MSGRVITLRLRHAPALRVDLRGITPTALAALTVAEIERLPITHGTQRLALAELFSITEAPSAQDACALRLQGDCARIDRIGWQMAGGTLHVDGPVGDHAGGGLRDGVLHITGDAGALAACEMSGGQLTIDGHVGDCAASALPGSLNGMCGGTLVVHGNAGDRFGDRMRRGTAVVHGNTGDFLASRMVAGTIAIGGTAGQHIGYGMRRGSVVFAQPLPPAHVPDTFVTAGAEAAVFWQLLARDLARHGGLFTDLPARAIERHLGDLAAGGKGELICTT